MWFTQLQFEAKNVKSQIGWMDLSYAFTCNSTKRKKRDKKTNRLERFELFLHMEIFEKNEKGLKRRISWEEFSISCQHMQYEQRNSKGSKRQIGWVGSFYLAIWDKVCQSLHVAQCALLWAQFVMEKGLLRQIHAIALCSCLKHIQTIVWILVGPICEKDTWQIHVIKHFLSEVMFQRSSRP